MSNELVKEIGSSEKREGIIEEPETSCTMINIAIKKLNRGLSELRDALKHGDNVEDLREYINDCLYEIEDLEDDFEYCRSQAIDIREWGQGWKDVALKEKE
jgi:hypothetical protein